MQKFTRPLTREIELAGTRLALTLSEQGVAVRIVGTRRPPWEMSWATLMCHLTGHSPKDGGSPTPEELTAAVEAFKKGDAPKKAMPLAAVAPAPPAASAPPAPAPSAERVTLPPTASGQVPALLARLEKWLASHRRRYREGLAAGASAADLDAASKDLGVPLPADLRALLAWHNGQNDGFIGHLESNWDLMSVNRIVETKHDLDAGDRSQTGWDPAWVPFLDDDAGDFVVVDTRLPGAPVREFWQGQTEHPVVAPSLAAWLERYVDAVEQGGYVEDPERGTFLRRK